MKFKNPLMSNNKEVLRLREEVVSRLVEKEKEKMIRFKANEILNSLDEEKINQKKLMEDFTEQMYKNLDIGLNKIFQDMNIYPNNYIIAQAFQDMNIYPNNYIIAQEIKQLVEFNDESKNEKRKTKRRTRKF